MARKIPKYEFKPDPTGSDLSKMLYLTPRQRRILAKWVLYSLLVVALNCSPSEFRLLSRLTAA